MAKPLRKFVPFGELKPDLKQFGSDGLTVAKNVVPVHANYIAAQYWITEGDRPADEPYGLHAHAAGGSTWYAYLGTITTLQQAALTGTVWLLTDKTRLVGGAYATSGAGGENGWQGASFGDAIVMTNYVDDPQLLTSPAAANFVKLAQSGGANPGMDPKAKFVFPVRNNLFLANLNLAAAFDGLPIGANPTAVAWSQSDNVRQYGSTNVTPQLVGAGYQPLSYDFGHITGGIGGDYGIVTLQSGIVRVDGPPYTFRPIVIGQGCRYPNSLIRFNDDVYFWSVAGPARLPGGEGGVETLGNEKVRRTLIDNNSAAGFSPTYSLSGSVLQRHVCAGRDIANGLVWWSYTSTSRTVDGGFTQYGDMSVVYNTEDGRFSFVENRESGLAQSGITFIRTAPDTNKTWAPGRDLIGCATWDGIPGVGGSNLWGLAVPSYSSAGASLPTLQRAFQQLDPDRTTRVLRVRPIYSRGGVSTSLTLTVTVASKNKPYATAASVSTTAEDSHGWFPLTQSVMADFHQVTFSAEGTFLETIAEFEGYEVEYITGPEYSA